MSFCGEFQNSDIFLHEIFRDGSLSLYEDSMHLTKIYDEYIFRNCLGMPGLAQIQKFMCTIFKNEGMHSVEAYCLDNMLFMNCQNFKSFILFEKFSGADFHNLWLWAPNLEPYYLFIYFLTVLFLSTLLRVTKMYLRPFLGIFHHFHFQPTYSP